MIRKVIVLVFGFGFLILGIAMILLPGPAILFIPLGLAILSLEFAWAQRLLDWLKQKIRRAPRERKGDGP